ncbi:MAG TPA: phosphate ABC transporter permease PstA [Candidatus Izemoplasmatales bacterium]|nr:phosphate ABC transporter permease PstA [Candidatus Izemoplasmatales bacterium]
MDFLLQVTTYLAASVALIVLSMIFIFVFRNGAGLLNFDLLTSDYHARFYNGGIEEIESQSQTEKPAFLTDTDYYSEKWGIALTDQDDKQGNPVIMISYIADDSPLKQMYDKNNDDNNDFQIQVGQSLSSIKFYDKNSALTIYGAQHMINELDAVDEFREMVFYSLGGGIRGSLITTLYTIGLTLLFALPVGIFTAIYLNEFAKKNKLTQIIRQMIEMLTGVPSIIYGLMGLAVFVPLTVRYTPATSGNILSGSLTLAVILLPVIIRATEESLKVVPDDFRSASLALGANSTQTTFKVVLPSALPGMLTATLLAIGRIIGESAALIFAIGTAVKDDITIFGKSTTLSVHIWSLLTDEPANIELASTIALIILIIVLILNLSVKLLSKRYIKKFSR